MPKQNRHTLAEEIQAAEKIQAAEIDRKENREMKITINLDNQGYKNKPKGQGGVISDRVRQASAQKEIEPAELLHYICNGYSIAPAAIGGNLDEWKPYEIDATTGERKRIAKVNAETGEKYHTSDFWQSQQVIYADIDNEKKDKTRIDRPLTPAAALGACRAAGIDPFCIYKTFNYSADFERFRVIVILDRPITDIKKANVLIKRFTQLFNLATAKEYQAAREIPEESADNSIEPVKLMFGGRADSVIYHSGNITPIEALEALPATAEEIKKLPTGKAAQTPKKSRKVNTNEQSEEEELIEALFAIDPRSLGQGEWLPIVAACKHEGISESIIDEWSSQDAARYDAEMNHIRYLSIDETSGNGKRATKLTIFYRARREGWKPTRNNYSLDWNDGLEADYPEPTADDIPPEIFEDANHQETAGGDPIQEQTTGGGNSESDNGSQEQAPQQKKGPIWYNAAKSIRPDNHNAPYDREIKELQKYANRKTGFDNIDRYLTLYPGLAALGGQASLGKTTFAVNLALSLLRQGEHVLYFALEQRAEELLTKVIAQYLYRTGNTDTTNLQLAAGKTSDAIDGARTNLAEQIEHFNIIECDFETTAATIEAIVTEYQNKKGVNPIVIVDYLQLIAEPFGFRGGDKERIDYNLKALKKMQKQHKLFVLVVSSFNRSSNLEPISYESFFGTSMIEYTCDYVFGLQLAIQDADNDEFYFKSKATETTRQQRNKMIHEEQQKNPKPVQFVAIKNRRGKQYFTANFDYYPAHDYFMETEGSNYTNGYSSIIDGTIEAAEKKMNIKNAFNFFDDDEDDE